jgi:uncharacterized membrane protein
MEQCISAICVLGLVVTAMLIMTRLINLEEAGNAIVKAFLLILALLTVICALKGALIAAFNTALAALKIGIAWLALIGLVLASVMVIARLVAAKGARAPVRRGDPHGGDV